MFVTAWMGILNLKTGIMDYANAGHNPPLFKSNGVYSYIHSKPNFILGPRANIKYEKETIQFKPGDTLVLYTDGITEAVRGDGLLYGEQRLLDYLNDKKFMQPDKLCNSLVEEVHNFVEGNEQSDDITVTAITFNGPVKHYEISVDATIENLEVVMNELNKILDENKQSKKMINKED